jgi:hypothetical protein
MTSSPQVRVEDFPVMPCEVTGFHIKPFGFFSGERELLGLAAQHSRGRARDAAGQGANLLIRLDDEDSTARGIIDG